MNRAPVKWIRIRVTVSHRSLCSFRDKLTISLKCWTFKLLSLSLSVIVVLAATFTFVHIIEPYLDIQDNKHKVSVEQMY